MFSSGRNTATGTDPSLIYNIHPLYANGNGTHEVANRADYTRLVGKGTISKVGTYINVQSGNICIGVYRGTPGRNNPVTRIATTGSVPCPAGGWNEIALDAAVAVDGATDWFAVSADNVVVQFLRVNMPGFGAFDGYKGFMAQEAGAFPLPALATPIAGGGARAAVIIGIP